MALSCIVHQCPPKHSFPMGLTFQETCSTQSSKTSCPFPLPGWRQPLCHWSEHSSPDSCNCTCSFFIRVRSENVLRASAASGGLTLPECMFFGHCYSSQLNSNLEVHVGAACLFLMPSLWWHRQNPAMAHGTHTSLSFALTPLLITETPACRRKKVTYSSGEAGSVRTPPYSRCKLLRPERKRSSLIYDSWPAFAQLLPQCLPSPFRVLALSAVPWRMPGLLPLWKVWVCISQ